MPNPDPDLNPLFTLLNPKQAVQYYQQLLTHFKTPDFKLQYQDKLRSQIQVDGRGFKPVAVTLGGLMSIAGAVVSYAVFDSIKYIITSPEVEQGQGFFSLSNQYYKVLLEKGLSPVVVPFNNLPMYGDAEKLLNILDEGAVILQGISAELGVWFGRNAGIGRLVIYRPENGVGVYRYV